MSDVIYYGTRQCDGVLRDGERCKNKSYFGVLPRTKEDPSKKMYVCGVHVRTHRNSSILPSMSIAQKEMAQASANAERNDLIDVARNLNIQKKQRGYVAVSKFRLMKDAPHIRGALSVFPNYRHGDRTDGYGAAQLSPMNLGPINHGSDILPPSKTLENYHQFAKVFRGQEKNGIVTEAYMKERREAYDDPVGHRHQPSAVPDENGNRNISLYAVHFKKDGTPQRFTYLESRWFYCYWYERLVKQTDEYKHLVSLINGGTNINIIGYDGYDVTDKNLWEMYNDISKPFGHELVLYALLVATTMPWTRYQNEHRALYQPFIEMFEESK